jgi:hypothetical protein
MTTVGHRWSEYKDEIVMVFLVNILVLGSHGWVEELEDGDFGVLVATRFGALFHLFLLYDSLDTIVAFRLRY